MGIVVVLMEDQLCQPWAMYRRVRDAHDTSAPTGVDDPGACPGRGSASNSMRARISTRPPPPQPRVPLSLHIGIRGTSWYWLLGRVNVVYNIVGWTGLHLVAVIGAAGVSIDAGRHSTIVIVTGFRW